MELVHGEVKSNKIKRQQGWSQTTDLPKQQLGAEAYLAVKGLRQEDSFKVRLSNL